MPPSTPTTLDTALAAHVEPGRYRSAEVQAVVAEARTSRFRARTLDGRPWLAVSIPGRTVRACGRDVVFGAPRGVLDDQAIRTIARHAAELWVDGRWYPADVHGIHLVVATSLTIVDQDGIAPEIARLADVPAEESRYVRDSGTELLRFVRLAWRPSRPVRS